MPMPSPSLPSRSRSRKARDELTALEEHLLDDAGDARRQCHLLAGARRSDSGDALIHALHLDIGEGDGRCRVAACCPAWGLRLRLKPGDGNAADCDGQRKNQSRQTGR
jgi:hypothetical protein